MRDRVILHLDMDAFFAAVEQRDRPELRGKPVIIGHPGPRGVVSTCSYEARKYGVRSAMPSVQAQRLCPEGIWIRGHHELYGAISRRIFTLFAEWVPIVEQLSVDEAFGDLTGAVADLQAGLALAAQIKKKILETEQLTASAGIAYCRFLAKIGSDLEKPDGLVLLRREDLPSRVWPLSVRVIPGVGPKLGEKLKSLGIQSVGDLALCPEDRLRREFGTALGTHLAERARGEDDTPVEPAGERKQVSEERTYGQDLILITEIEREMLARCEAVAAELRRKGVLARTITLKVRDGAFHTWTRSQTLPEPVDLAQDLYQTARELFRTRIHLAGRGVRLLGVGAKDLVHSSEVPPVLFPDEQREKLRAAARAADQLRERFGESAVRPARLVDKRPKSN